MEFQLPITKYHKLVLQNKTMVIILCIGTRYNHGTKIMYCVYHVTACVHIIMLRTDLRIKIDLVLLNEIYLPR